MVLVELADRLGELALLEPVLLERAALERAALELAVLPLELAVLPPRRLCETMLSTVIT